MNNLIFWKDWDQKSRLFTWAFFIFFCLAGLYLVYGYFYGLSNIIDWETRQDLVPIPFNQLTLHSGPLQIRIPADQFLVFQNFEGSILQIDPVFWLIYLIFLVISINLILSVLSTISKFWFYGAMGAFIGFVIFMQPDNVMLFGSREKAASIFILSVYLSIGYIFREFKPGASLLNRFLVFAAATVITGLIIYRYAGVQHPFSYLVSYGIGAPVVVSVFFILTVSHEIIYAILYISSGSSRSGSSRGLFHFTLLSLVYIFYVFITFLHNTQKIHWNLIYLNPVIVLLIISFTGFWWLKNRENLYSEILPFKPGAALLFLGFGAMTFATYGFIFSVGNDPVAETFEDTIIFGQIGFGIMFFLYIIANFGAMLSKGWNIIPVSYKSRTIPFFIFRSGGLLATGFILYQAGFYPFFQAKAGYYNFIGDLFWQQKKQALAKEYYIRASQYEYQNHRSNYALASIARLQGNKAEEINYLEIANLKQPSPYAYVNESNRLLENDQYFEGLFKLTEGWKQFPGSARILNNLGYFYSKTDIFDSSFYFFNRARKINPRLKEITANSYALLAKAGMHFSLDSVKNELGSPRSLPGSANYFALANEAGQTLPLPISGLKSENLKTPAEFALTYNAGLNGIAKADTTFYNRIHAAAMATLDPVYANNLYFVYALGMFRNHKQAEAFRVLEDLATRTYPDAKYLNILGELHLAAGDARGALSEYNKITSLPDPADRLYFGVALLISGEKDSASVIFRSLVNSGNQEIRQSAMEYYNLTRIVDRTDTLSDELKYDLFHYHLMDINENSTEEMIRSVKNPMVRDLIRVEFAIDLLDENRRRDAKEWMQQLESNDGGDSRLKKMAENINLLIAADEIREKGSQADTSYLRSPVNDPDFLYSTYKNASLAMARGDTIGARRFIRVLSWDPFFEKGILLGVDYYNQDLHDPIRAYEVLVNALGLNRFSIRLNQAFVLQSIKVNIPEYARNSLTFLEKNMNTKEFRQFRQEADSVKRAENEKAREWGF